MLTATQVIAFVEPLTAMGASAISKRLRALSFLAMQEGTQALRFAVACPLPGCYGQTAPRAELFAVVALLERVDRCGWIAAFIDACVVAKGFAARRCGAMMRALGV